MIKKIKLTKVENYLDCNLERNIISIGFDVSVHSTGIALLRTTDNSLIIEQTHKIITPKKVPARDSILLFTEQLDDYKRQLIQKFKIDATIIEDCFFGKNVIVLKALARHSALVLDRFNRFSKVIKFIYPKSARKIVGINTGKLKAHQLKKCIIEFVNDLLGLELKVKDNDIADAIVLALCGLIKEA